MVCGSSAFGVKFLGQAKPRTTRRVVALFFSILVTTTAPISAVLATWVPPQGWKSISSPSPPASRIGALDAPRAARRLHRHALDQRRIGVQFLVGDRAHRDRKAGRDQAGDALGQRFLVQRIGHVEVQPRIVGRDRAAVDQLRHQVAQQVGRGVKAHQPVAALPVDPRRDAVAGLDARQQGLLARRRQMQMSAVGRPSSSLPLRVSAIASSLPSASTRMPLSPAWPPPSGIEHGAVQDDALLAHAGHGGGAFLEVGVFAEQGLEVICPILVMCHALIFAVSAYSRAQAR